MRPGEPLIPIAQIFASRKGRICVSKTQIRFLDCMASPLSPGERSGRLIISTIIIQVKSFLEIINKYSTDTGTSLQVLNSES